MILQRLTRHIRSLNWIAVLVDFVVVVAGVFLGLQMSIWDEERSNRRDYHLTRQFFKAELEANLAATTRVESELAPRLERVSAALDLLRSCEDSPENRDKIAMAALQITGTFGLNLRTAMLSRLTENQTLRAQQTPEERTKLSDLKYILDFYQREAKYIEELPLRERVSNNPLIGIGDVEEQSRIYQGAEWKGRNRPFFLTEPVDIACKNNDLVKSIYYWERWQSQLLIVANNVHEVLQGTLEDMKDVNAVSAAGN